MKNKNLLNLDQNILVAIVNDLNNGKINEALIALERLINEFPGHALLFNLRGACFESKSQYEKSIESFSKAVEINPNYAEALYNLGVVQKKAGKIDDAIYSYQKTLDIDSNNANAHNNLGNLLTEKGLASQSIKYFNKAVSLNPKFAEAHNNLGLANMELNKFNESINSFLFAIECKPHYESPYINLGRAYRELNEIDNEVNCYKKFLKINPNAPKFLSKLGRTYRNMGKNKLAINCFESSLNSDPHSISTYFELAMCPGYIFNKNQIAKIESYAKNKETNESDKINLNFALASIYEKNEDTDKFISSLNLANSLNKKSLKYSLNDDEKKHSIIRDFFQGTVNSDKLETDKKLKLQNPIFIVGMPRSGSTLIEQILSSHKNIYGGGELQIFQKILKPFINNYLRDKQDFKRQDKSCYDLIRNQYLESINEIDFKEEFFTDKNLLNYQYIGLILRALPESKIVHIERDARAVCWSNYNKNFAHRIPFSNDLNDLVGFYKLYEEQMKFWHANFPNQIYDLQYESMTNNQKIETEKLLNFCNLDWDENCLNFYENNRAVKTASKDQVRKKMYSGSSDAWKKYKNYLKPLVDGF